MNRIRRIIFCLLALCAAAFLLAGRNTTDSHLHIPAGVTVVRYWEKWTGSEAEQMRRIVNEFNATVGRDKHIHVQFASISNVEQKTLVAISAGVPPDIAGLWDQQVYQFAALGAVEPLDDLAAAHGITRETYLPVYWDGCRYNGRLYGLVSTPAAVALLYNKQVFRDAGLDPERPPRTLQELDRCAAAIDTRDAAGHLDRAGYVPLQSWYVPFTCYWFGGKIFDPSTQKFCLTDAPSVNAFRWIQGYSRRLGTAALEDFSSTHPLANFDSPQNPFLTGKLAMQQQGPWMANYIAHLKPSMSRRLVPPEGEAKLSRRTDNYEWAMAPFPSAVPGLEDVAFCTFDVLMIPAGAPHKAQAFEFLAYLNRQDVMERLCTLHCKSSPLRRVSPEFLARHPNPYIDVFQRLAASPNAFGVPPVPIWPQVFRDLSDAAQAVALEGADPEQILGAVQDRLQAEYDRFRRIQAARGQDVAP